MAKEEGKRLDLVKNLKDIVTGLLVILSLLGASYGSFKPESEARETYELLAPDVDMMLEEADANLEFMHTLEARVIKLEAEKTILQNLLIGYLTAQGHYQLPKSKQTKEVKPIPLPLIESMPEPEQIQQQAPPKIKRRKRAEPDWKK